MDNNKVKLAEFVGWDKVVFSIPGEPDRVFWHHPQKGIFTHVPPDPFTDANDDYAVLEWMRRHAHDYGPMMSKHSAWLYQIGDYARAALKVIQIGP